MEDMIKYWTENHPEIVQLTKELAQASEPPPIVVDPREFVERWQKYLQGVDEAQRRLSNKRLELRARIAEAAQAPRKGLASL